MQIIEHRFCSAVHTDERHSAPAQIAITGRDHTGANLAPKTGSCPGSLAPGASCYFGFNTGANVSCKFQSSGKVRAVAMLHELATTRPVLGIPATK
jgi:hypothetical protein